MTAVRDEGGALKGSCSAPSSAAGRLGRGGVKQRPGQIGVLIDY
jgi:hypothetical protein